MIPKQRNYKIKQIKQTKRAPSAQLDQLAEIRRLHAKFEQEKQKYMGGALPDGTREFYNDMFEDFDDEPLDEAPKPVRPRAKNYVQQLLEQRRPRSEADYASIFLNPASTTIECQRAYIRLCAEANPHLEGSPPSIQRLTQSQYYPPLKRYNDVLQIVKQIPGMEKQMNVEFPPLGQFFDRPQSELFEMIAFVNVCINRALGQDDKPPLDVGVLNLKFIIQQEMVAIKYVEEMLHAPSEIIEELQLDKHLLKRYKTGQFFIAAAQQQLALNEALKPVYQTGNLKQCLLNSDILKQKELFKAARRFEFTQEIGGQTVKSGATLIEELLKTHAAVVYTCQIDDQMSPFTRNAQFWRLREKFVVFSAGCSQLTVTVCVVDQQKVWNTLIQGLPK